MTIKITLEIRFSSGWNMFAIQQGHSVVITVVDFYYYYDIICPENRWLDFVALYNINKGEEYIRIASALYYFKAAQITQ